MHRLPHFVGNEIETRAFWPQHFDVFRAHVRRNACPTLQSKHDDLALKVASELADIFIIGIQNGSTAMRKGLNQFIFRARDAGNRIETLQMYGSNICDHRLIGQGDTGQAAISPACDIPISTTATSYSGSSVSSPSGRPK